MIEMTVEKIDIQHVFIAPDRARKDFGDVEQLAQSIRDQGLINPILVRRLPNGPKPYELIAGERRFRAFCMAGVGPLIPAHVKDEVSDLELKVYELEENVQRKNLSWKEESENLRQIHELRQKLALENQQKWTLENTAEVVGRSKGLVSQQINLAKKLQERPDLAAKVQHLPLHPAIREIQQIEEAERFERLAKAKKSALSETEQEGTTKTEPDLDFQLCDALGYLSTLADESVDLILTDPPFGLEDIETMRQARRGSVTQSYTSKLSETDNMTKSSVVELMAKVLPEFGRVLRPGSHFYIFFEFGSISHLVDLMPKELVVEWPLLIWDKGRTTTTFTGYNYPSCAEAILFGYKAPRSRRLQKASKQILTYAPLHSKDKVHPFQKPEALLMFLITQSSFIGQTVLDPFAGSGSTLKAALKCGRLGRGCEPNRDNFCKAQVNLYAQEEASK